MLTLIKKDLSQSSFINGVLSQVLLYILISNQYEEKKKSYIMINSLPLKRAEFVAAKYLSTLLIAITPVLLIYLCGLIFNIFSLPFTVKILGLQSVFAILINIAIILSLYFPLYYCLKNYLLSIGLFLIV